MKHAGISIWLAGCLIAGAGTAFAGNVNCAQVNKYLQTGRTVQEVAETMVISEDEVKKCQAAAQTGAQPAAQAPAAGSGGAPSGAAGETKK